MVRPEADLAVVKAVFPQTVVVGQEVTYQLQASNLGPETALEVSVDRRVPGGRDRAERDDDDGHDQRRTPARGRSAR